MLLCKRGAFYCILFSHEYYVCRNRLQIGGLKCMVIWEDYFIEGQPHTAQLPEKTIWITDARQGAYFFADELVSSNRQTRLKQVMKQMAFKLHQKAAWHYLRPITDNGIRLHQPGFSFAQRTGRQYPSIAKAPIAVYHHDFNIALQFVVLQPVIAKDDVTFRVRLQQATAYCNPIPPYPY